MTSSVHHTTQTTNTSSVIATCIFSSGCLGLACYEENTDQIEVFQAWDDDKGSTPHQTLQLALLHLAPTVVYVISTASLELLDVLQASSVPGQPSPDIQFEKSSVFQIDYVLDRLQYLQVASMPESLRREDQIHWLQSRINFTSTQQIRALGALLYILHKGKTTNESMDDSTMDEADDEVVRVEDLAEFSLDGYLMVDRNALVGLQIFQEDNHPSILGIGRSKEGFSLFGIMNRCVTSSGRRMLQSWFLRPMLNLEMINDRLTAIQLLVNKPELLRVIRDALKQVKDSPLILKSLQSFHARHKVKLFAQLRASIEATLHLSRMVDDFSRGLICQSNEETSGWSSAWKDLMIVQKFKMNITDQLLQCSCLIADVVDLESEEEDLFIKPGICPDLDKLKKTYDQLPDFLTQIVEKELNRIPRFLTSRGKRDLWSIVYVPQVGYLIQILGHPLGAEILDVLDDYQQAFESTAEDGALICYYKGRCTDILNQQYGDMLHKIQDMENSLSAELICQIVEHKGLLIRANCVSSELDCLAALALAAHEGQYCCPVVSEDNTLVIEEGRHPLTEVIVDGFIPNNTHLTEQRSKIQLITGPNASGKSSYLKQVALIVFLSHIGSFVPAKSCKIGLTDRIFTRICTSQESKTQRIQQSSFLLDLSQMFTMVKQATSRSLLIIDEFGKGTLTTDGVGLLTSMLEYWANQDPSPRVLACTHFTEVVNTGLLQKSLKIQFFTMQVIVNEENHHTVLFKLISGCVAANYGINCARICGMPESVISRAKEILLAKQCRKHISFVQPDRLVQQEKKLKTCLDHLKTVDAGSSSLRDRLKQIESVLLHL